MPNIACAENTGASGPAAHDVPRQVYWGDTHLHTRLSTDAFSFGNPTLGPEEAYRFARGEAVTAQNGMQARLRRPLDFLVVSDHAEFLGLFAGIMDGNADLLESEAGARLYKYLQEHGPGKLMGEFARMLGGTDDVRLPASFGDSAWRQVCERADRHNDPGQFTAFIGYEYTSMPNRANLHRNVIFRDGADLATVKLPFTANDSPDPEDLWKALAGYERDTGGSVLAIPHNGNTSSGLMFDTLTLDGGPLTADYARKRSRWEPLYEVTQIKGDGETHPVLSPNDEFADYETWNSWLGPTYNGVKSEGWERRKASEYARSALKLGLQVENQLGANPFKFGLIGSTDSHTALATATEDNFWGKFGTANPAPNRWNYSFVENDLVKRVMGDERIGHWVTAASGLAAVWARENTREALFDAMRRREVYATTGSRITVRLFGGWSYPGDAHTRPNYVDIGYTGGVPMGGDLPANPAGAAPVFIVVAAKDPDEANLDRIQIIKGWLDGQGVMREKIYDVAWSGQRVPSAQTGKLPAVGSTVNLANATYDNTIGEPLLSATWTDPDFDPSERSFYYSRVLEIPKPRWTTYDAARFGTELPPAHVPGTTQDRAYTSPIWYTPR